MHFTFFLQFCAQAYLQYFLTKGIDLLYSLFHIKKIDYDYYDGYDGGNYGDEDELFCIELEIRES